MKNEWKLSYSDKLKNVKEQIIQDMKEINSCLKEKYANNCIIIILSLCNLDGESKHITTIHIYDNFIDANPLLNQEQYDDYKDKNISVIQYNLVKDKFLFILVKTNDKYNYKRLNKRQSQKMFDEFGIDTAINFLYNEIETKIILH